MLRNRIAVKIAFFINGFVYANWVSRLPRIQELYSADNGTIGIVLLSLSLGAVAAMPITGWLIIKNGSRRITLLSVVMYCFFIPLIPLMGGVVALIFLFLTMGIATGMLDVAMNAQAVMVEHEYKRPIMTSFHAFFSIGMAMGAWCGTLFTDFGFDLFYHFSIITVLSLVASFWVRQNLVQDKPDKTSVTDGPLFRIPNKALISIGIIAFCCMMGEGAMADWTVNYMENVVLSPKTLAPLALSAFATAMTAGRIFGDKARAVWGDRKLIIGGGIMATVGLALALAVPMFYTSMVGFFLVGLGLATIVPITYSIAGSTKELPSGVGLAMVTTVGYSGFLFGPPIIGLLADLTNLRIGLLLVVVLFLLMTTLGFTRKKKSTS